MSARLLDRQRLAAVVGRGDHRSVFGRLADQWGRRRLFALGALVFGLSSILAATADTAGWLIGARALQGIGGAMMLPTSLSLLNATFRGRERGAAFGIWGATIGGAAALGPLLGGWLTTSFSWRWAFGINIPLTLLVILGLYLFVAESKEPSTGRGAAKRGWYVWRDGTPERPPNNWRAALTQGPAWTWDGATSQWYLHLFLPEQPDLNWANPEVVAAMHQI